MCSPSDNLRRRLCLLLFFSSQDADNLQAHLSPLNIYDICTASEQNIWPKWRRKLLCINKGSKINCADLHICVKSSKVGGGVSARACSRSLVSLLLTAVQTLQLLRLSGTWAGVRRRGYWWTRGWGETLQSPSLPLLPEPSACLACHDIWHVFYGPGPTIAVKYKMALCDSSAAIRGRSRFLTG